MTTSFASAVIRLAFAIVLEAAAFIVWDIGTRSPARVLADLAAGAPRPGLLAAGAVRFVTGAAAVAAAIVISLPLVHRTRDFTIVECLLLFAALGVEALVGERLRARR